MLAVRARAGVAALRWIPANGKGTRSSCPYAVMTRSVLLRTHDDVRKTAEVAANYSASASAPARRGWHLVAAEHYTWWLGRLMAKNKVLSKIFRLYASLRGIVLNQINTDFYLLGLCIFIFLKNKFHARTRRSKIA